ncbi:MAG TPA: ABC transporter substrate-binding protein [Ktedonobacteraceae bacterium]|nr:ABC transporter substrate-binding protein [Ktedonobacteraceae bacterium]
MYFSIKRLASCLSGLLLIGVLISACGGSSAPTGTTTGTPGSASTPAPVTLNVGQINDSINFFPFYVAEQMGYFKAQNITLGERPRLQTGPKVVAALEAGSIDIGGAVITDAFGMAKVDPSARIIGALTNGYVVDVVVSKKFAQDTHLTEASPLADKINALKGKKIGITGPNTGTEALLTYLFKLQGMDAHKDATLISLGSNNSAALTALVQNRVDALSFFSPIGQAAEAQGAGNIFISPDNGDVPDLKGDVHGLFFTKQSTIDAKPQAIAGFIRAVSQAESYIQANPDKAKELLNGYLKLGDSVSQAVYTATSPVWAKNPTLSESTYNVASQFHLKAGLIKAAPPYDTLVDSSVIAKAIA